MLHESKYLSKKLFLYTDRRMICEKKGNFYFLCAKTNGYVPFWEVFASKIVKTYESSYLHTCKHFLSFVHFENHMDSCFLLKFYFVISVKHIFKIFGPPLDLIEQNNCIQPIAILNFACADFETVKQSLKGNFWGDFLYYFKHCFIFRPANSTVSEDAGIKSRTFATLALSQMTLLPLG